MIPHSFRAALFGAASIVFLAAPRAYADKPLAMQFKPGVAGRYTLVNLEQTTGKLGKNIRKNKFKMILDMQREIVSTDEAGVATVKDSIVRARISMEGDYSAELDSAGDAPTDARFLGAHESLQKLAGERLSFRLSPHGELSEFEISKQLKELFRAEARKQAGLLLNETSLRELFERAHPPLPAEPAAVGANWSRDIKFPMRFAPVAGEAKYEYVGSAGKEGQELEVVKISGDIDIDRSSIGANPKPITLSKELSGEAWIDAAVGQLVRCTTRAIIELKVPNGGGGQFGEMKVELTTSIEPFKEDPEEAPKSDDKPKKAVKEAAAE